jgi:Flp pilus assembly protein TadG
MMTHRTLSRALRRDDGTLTLFTVIVVIGLLAAVAFITDAGQKLAAASQAEAIAQQAARAGAAEVNTSAAYAHGGTFTVDPAQAAAAARSYLAANGQIGTVTITGDQTVTVVVTVTKPAAFGVIIGLSSLSATESATANIVSGITGPQNQP